MWVSSSLRKDVSSGDPNPLRYLPRRARNPRAESNGGRVAETILVVDDDPDITRFIELNLRDAGYHVAVVTMSALDGSVGPDG
jgi:hypothetical protein